MNNPLTDEEVCKNLDLSLKYLYLGLLKCRQHSEEMHKRTGDPRYGAVLDGVRAMQQMVDEVAPLMPHNIRKATDGKQNSR